MDFANEWSKTLKTLKITHSISRRSLFEYGGGLGDVFNGLFHRGSYNLLDNLRAGEQATVALICHNPHA
jgi:hypothetical protein